MEKQASATMESAQPRIAVLTAQYNTDLAAQALAELLAGVMYSFLTLLVFFVLAFLLTFIFLDLSLHAASVTAFILTLLFGSVCAGIVWKGIRPPMDPDREESPAETEAEDAAGKEVTARKGETAKAKKETGEQSLDLGAYRVRFNPSDLPPFVHMFVSGPTHLTDALFAWRERIEPHAVPDLARRSAALLAACGVQGLESTSIAAGDTDAVLLLRRLGLAKFKQPDMRTRVLWLKTTQKGRDVLGTPAAAFKD